MDYEHLYRYLNTRPIEEIESCLDNVTKLVKERTSRTNETSTQAAPIDKLVNKTLVAQLKQETESLRVSQRVWMEQAVWSTFGAMSPVTFNSTLSLSAATSNLKQLTTATSFIQSVNSIIDREVKESGGTVSTKPSAQIPRHSLITSSQQPHKQKRKRELLPASSTSSNSSDSKEDYSSDWQSVADSKSMSNGSDDNFLANEEREPSQPSRSRKRKRAFTTRVKWTASMDDALLMAVAEHKDKGWEVVASEVNGGLTANQCAARWNSHLLPQQHGMQKKSDFSADEIRKLYALVKENTKVERRKDGTLSKVRINWKAVGSALGVIPYYCLNKWTALQQKGFV